MCLQLVLALLLAPSHTLLIFIFYVCVTPCLPPLSFPEFHKGPFYLRSVIYGFEAGLTSVLSFVMCLCANTMWILPKYVFRIYKCLRVLQNAVEEVFTSCTLVKVAIPQREHTLSLVKVLYSNVLSATCT